MYRAEYALIIKDKIKAQTKRILNCLKYCDCKYIAEHFFFKKFDLFINHELIEGDQFNELIDFVYCEAVRRTVVWAIGTEFVEGPNFEDIMPLESDDLLRYIVQVVSGLEWLHSRGIIHCNIRPKNIVLHSETDIVIFFRKHYTENT